MLAVVFLTTFMAVLAGFSSRSVSAQVATDQNEVYAERTLIRGLTFLRTGYPDKAVSVFENGLKVLPNNSVLLSAMAEAQRAHGDIQLALFYIEKAVLQSPDKPDYIQQLVEIALDANQIGIALSQSERLIDLLPNEPRLVLQRLNLLISVGHIPEAHDLAARSLEQYSTSETVLRVILDAFIRSGDLQSAVFGARKLSLLTDSIEDQLMLATLLIQSGEPDEALTELAEILADDPNHARARQTLVGLRDAFPETEGLEIDEYPNAQAQDPPGESQLDVLLRRLELDPADAAAAEELGQIYMASEKYEDAILLAEAQIETDPRQLVMWELGIRAHLQLDHKEAALTLGEDASILFPGYAPLMLEYARALLSAGRHQEAVDVASNALKRTDLSPELTEQLTQLLNQLEQYQ